MLKKPFASIPNESIDAALYTLEEYKEDVAHIYDEMFTWMRTAKKEKVGNASDAQIGEAVKYTAGLGGQATGSAMKRLKAGLFFRMISDLKTERDDITITVTNYLSKELIGRSFSKKSILKYASSNRTAANKVDASNVSKQILEERREKFIKDLNRLIDEANAFKSDQRSRYKARMKAD